MCTREETQSIVDASEKRMEAKMDACRADVDERIEGLDQKLYKSHNAIAAVQSDMGATLKRLTDKLEEFGNKFTMHDAKEIEYQKKVDAHLSQKQLSQEHMEKLVEMVQDYTEKKVLEKSVGKLRNMVIGFAGLCAAVGVIIASTVAAIKHLLK